MISKITTLAAAVMAIGLFSGPAMAGYPPSIAGNWHATANQTELAIDIQQASTGGSCSAISGTIANATDGTYYSTLVGFYCPATGRFNFIRVGFGLIYEDYSGNAADIGDFLIIGGIVASLTSFGEQPIGEYSFGANIPPQLSKNDSPAGRDTRLARAHTKKC